MSNKIKYSLVILAGTMFSLCAFYFINYQYIKSNRQLVSKSVYDANDKVNRELKKINLVIESMGSFVENSNSINKSVFLDFTDPFLSSLTGIKALEWAPLINDSIKEVFESSHDLLITEKDSLGLQPTSQKEFYFPVEYINPIHKNEKAHGFDLYSNLSRKLSIDATLNSGGWSFTAPINLVQENGTSKGFLVLKYVENKENPYIKGLVLGVYNMDDFISNILTSELEHIDVKLVDIKEGDLLYSSYSKNINMYDQQIIEVGGRDWGIQYGPKPEMLSFPHITESYIILLFGWVISVLLLVIIKRRDNYNNSLMRKIQARTQELDLSNRQKGNLLKEIHHRVKNNLQITSSIINLQKRTLTDKKAIGVLEDSQDRIAAMALIHQKLYQTDGAEAVNLNDYLIDLVKCHQRFSQEIDHAIVCPNISLSLEKAVPLGLIISELVTNALKHAYLELKADKTLRITVEEKLDHTFLMQVEDNGIGLPSGFDVKTPSSLGFEIINSLCEQIDAEISYSTSGNGTKFGILFKD